jgi:hypothetical protein
MLYLPAVARKDRTDSGLAELLPTVGESIIAKAIKRQETHNEWVNRNGKEDITSYSSKV